jgi:hypothetical protein
VRTRERVRACARAEPIALTAALANYRIRRMATVSVVIPKAEQDQIKGIVSRCGERAAAATLEVNPVTLARAAAGFGIARITAAAIRAKLAAVAADG